MKRTLAVLVMVLLATTPAFAGKIKNKKKEKRFDPVTISSVADVEGNYRGIQDDHILELRVAEDGKSLVGNYGMDGRRSPLRKVTLSGSTITIVTSDDDTLTGTFKNRVRDGETAFGVLLEGFYLYLEGGTTIQRVFFARVSP